MKETVYRSFSSHILLDSTYLFLLEKPTLGKLLLSVNQEDMKRGDIVLWEIVSFTTTTSSFNSVPHVIIKLKLTPSTRKYLKSVSCKFIIIRCKTCPIT